MRCEVGGGIWDVGCGIWDVGCGMGYGLRYGLRCGLESEIEIRDQNLGCGIEVWDLRCGGRGSWDLGIRGFGPGLHLEGSQPIKREELVQVKQAWAVARWYERCHGCHAAGAKVGVVGGLEVARDAGGEAKGPIEVASDGEPSRAALDLLADSLPDPVVHDHHPPRATVVAAPRHPPLHSAPSA